MGGIFLAIRWSFKAKGVSNVKVMEGIDLSSSVIPNTASSEVNNRRTTVTILQFLVGGLVTMGGSLFAAYAINSFGKTLGLIHLSIGITGLIGAFAILKGAVWSRKFLVVINIITIGYSSLSESVVQVDSLLPSPSSTGSLIGTIIAIIMSCAILALLRKPIRELRV